MKRIILFLLTNVLVIVTLSILVEVLGLRGGITQAGIDYPTLIGFCLVWGMGGAFISLAMSRMSAKWMMGVKLVEPSSPGEAGEMCRAVHDLARKAGLPIPEVGVYDSPEINAFATGPTKSRSLVAVSTGLMQAMNNEETLGVLAHEVAHIKNGDMVTMTLIQGVINAFTMFLSRIIAWAITQNVREEDRRFYSSLIVIAGDIILGFLGFMVVCWFSRQREFRADRGSAVLTGGKTPMLQALKALQRRFEPLEGETQAAMACLKISGKRGKFGSLFATHPPLEERISVLQASNIA